MNISVVIPTCNRKPSLLSLLQNLNDSTLTADEIIIIDAGEERLSEKEYFKFKNLKIQYLFSEKTVCKQRNLGINKAKSSWIFICDDDMEVPADYLQILAGHIEMHPEAGAVSGLVLQKEKNKWTGEYPEKSGLVLTWKFLFGLGIWGSIECSSKNFIIKKIKKHYRQKGNHLSKAGWPVLTDFSGSFFTTPVYGLGASLIKKEWLLNSPYDEVLDRHGIGDHYGVAAGFPAPHIHILTDAFVYHQQETENRLHQPLQFYRRVLSLDYFIKTKKNLSQIKRRWLLWSLTGNLVYFMIKGKWAMVKAALKSFMTIAFGKNPYTEAAVKNKKITEPGF